MGGACSMYGKEERLNRVLVRKPEGKRQPGRPRRRWEDNIKMDLHDWLLQQIFNPLQPGGHYMDHQVNIQQFYVLLTQCIYVFCVDLRTNSDYFSIQH
jgi:hypothetical protein